MTQDIQQTDTPAHFAIASGNIFDGEAFIGPGIVEIAGGRIAAVHAPGGTPAGVPVVRMPEGVVLSPGFVDLQVNGGGGRQLNNDPTVDGARCIASAHARAGTTSLLLTLITDAPEAMARLLVGASAVAAVPGVAGFHLEGPFINPARRGIHPEAHVRTPGDDDVRTLAAFRAHGRTMTTLAPEILPEGLLERLSAAGVVVSIGHSEATSREVEEAARAGASCVTHLFNAMSQLQARAPGVVGATLAHDRLAAGIICDGIHVDPSNVRAAWRCLGSSRLFLVSDAMATAASPVTGFTLNGRRIRLDEGRLTDDAGTLAGAHATMADCVRIAVERAGIPLADALRMATATPADVIGLGGEAGRIRRGAQADIVALAGHEVAKVWQAGRQVDLRA